MKLPLAERFVSFQGEGSRVGRRAFFLRLMGCNATCSWCDTKYTWHKEHLVKSELVECSKLIEEIVSARPEVVVLTGGEPMLHAKALGRLLNDLSSQRRLTDVSVEVETNGLISPSTLLDSQVHEPPLRVLFNVSPKLPASAELERPLPYESTVLREFTDLHSGLSSRNADAIFKFVVRLPHLEKDLREVVEFCRKFRISRRSCYLMAEGQDPQEQLKALAPLMEAALPLGFQVSPRLHVLAWGARRGV